MGGPGGQSPSEAPGWKLGIWVAYAPNDYIKNVKKKNHIRTVSIGPTDVPIRQHTFFILSLSLLFF